MIRPNVLALLLPVVASCGSKSTPWVAPPVARVTGTSGGIAFSVEIADGMKPDAALSEGDVTWKDRPNGLEVTVSKRSTKASLEIAIETMPLTTHFTVLRKDALPDGYIVTMQESDAFNVQLERFIGDGALHCHASYYPNTRAEPLTAVVALLEKMCLSAKPT